MMATITSGYLMKLLNGLSHELAALRQELDELAARVAAVEERNTQP
jgi:hypothetical protein